MEGSHCWVGQLVKGCTQWILVYWIGKSHAITFKLSKTETMIDYIFVNNKYRSNAKDVKVIPGEEIVSQPCLLLMDMVLMDMRRSGGK